MLAKVTVEVDGRVVGVVDAELSGGAAATAETIRRLHERTGRMMLEPTLQQVADRTPAPCGCGHTMKNCGRRVMSVLSTFGEIPVERRRYRCLTCGQEAYPADAHYCCGHHRLTRPLRR